MMAVKVMRKAGDDSDMFYSWQRSKQDWINICRANMHAVLKHGRNIHFYGVKILLVENVMYRYAFAM